MTNDSRRHPSFSELVIRLSSFNLFDVTRHCHNCGCEYKLPGNPGRIETCPQCGADLKVCLNCIHHDKSVAEQCRERRADLVQEKHMANFCEYFDMVKRVWGAKGANQREENARDQLRKLFGD